VLAVYLKFAENLEKAFNNGVGAGDGKKLRNAKGQQNMFWLVSCCGQTICFGWYQSKNDASSFLSVIIHFVG